MSLRRRYRPKRRPPKQRTEDEISDANLETVEDEEVLADYGERILEALKGGKEVLKSISHYELVEELGKGGMGTVFLGNQVSEGGVKKQVAIKVLKDTTHTSSIKMFVEEAQLLAQLCQGTIVEFLALESMEVDLPGKVNPRTRRRTSGTKSKIYFMVLEYVNGPGLNEVLRTHADNVLIMHPAMVGFILNKATIALAEAHTLTDKFGNPLNLVHRDISPSNILFNAKAGITKLADFGVARAFGGDAEEEEGREEEQHLVGKARYMAPEQMEGHATAKSDVWALGTIGYEALTGFSPYRLYGKKLRERVKHIQRQFGFPLRPPHEIIRSTDTRFNLESLSAIIMQCLQQDPKNRPSSVELNALLEGEYLYNRGLGPTNKTLGAYLKLLECAIGDGEVVPPPEFLEGEDATVLCNTLWVEDPLSVFRRRGTSAYRSRFLKAIKAKQANPCLLPNASGELFQPPAG